MPPFNESLNWTHMSCETCMKNAGDTVRMVCEEIGPGCPEMMVCPQCGSTKRL